MIRLDRRQHKNIEKLSNESDIDEKIDELRSKLNKALESNIDTNEIIRLSQELDKYIVYKQRRFAENINYKKK